MSRWLLQILVVFASLMSLARTTHAGPPLEFQDPAAAAEFQRALEAWEREDFATAAEALDTTYAIEPRPDLLYSRAQARRMLGRCQDALALFEAYLATNPSDPAKVRDTRINIERCRTPPATGPGSEVGPPASDPGPEEPSSASAAASDDRSPRAPPPSPWRRDALAAALLGVGGVSVVTGGVLFGATTRADDRARRAGTYGEFRREHTAATRRNQAATVMTAVGSAIVIAGLVRWAILARRSRPSRPSRARLRPVAGST